LADAENTTGARRLTLGCSPERWRQVVADKTALLVERKSGAEAWLQTSKQAKAV